MGDELFGAGFREQRNLIERQSAGAVRGEDRNGRWRHLLDIVEKQARQSFDAPIQRLRDEHGGPGLIDAPEAPQSQWSLVFHESAEPSEVDGVWHTNHQRTLVLAEGSGNEFVNSEGVKMERTCIAGEMGGLLKRQAVDVSEAEIAGSAAKRCRRSDGEFAEAMEVELATMLGQVPGGVVGQAA